MKNYKSSKILYFSLAPILSCLILFFYFQINPFSDLGKYYFQYDGLFVFFWIKNIAVSKSFYCPNQLAYPILDTNCFRDFVLDHNYLEVMIYYIIAFFTKNLILIQLIYSYVTNILIALVTNLVLMKFRISKFLGILISTFFSVALAKIFFIHNFTMGFYFGLPLVFLIIYWFFEDKVSFIKIDSSKKLILSPNKYFFYTVIFGFLTIISSAYYAYMFLIILSFGFLMIYLRNGKMNIQNLNILLVLIIFLLYTFFVCFGNFIFNYKYGFADIISRSYKTTSVFEMSFTSLSLPAHNHYLEFMRNFYKYSRDSYFFNSSEGLNHNIGIFALLGYCLILLFQMRILFDKNYNRNEKYFKFLGAEFTKNRTELLKFFAVIALLTFLYFSSGGFYRITHLLYSQFRVICRFNIIFTLLGLIFWGIYFDQLIEQQKNKSKQYVLKIMVMLIFVIGYLEAVGMPNRFSNDFAENKRLYENDKKFVTEIENYLPKQSKIFIYPVFGFPEVRGDWYRSVSGYLHSNDLIFSYPTPKNRKSHLWQKEVSELEFEKFIFEIKKAGFSGVWVEKYFYYNMFIEEVSKMEENLKKIGKKVIISNDQKLVFYEI
ncbi:MAG: hypothetical protein ACO201_01880 [Rickettsiales bacterium]